MNYQSKVPRLKFIENVAHKFCFKISSTMEEKVQIDLHEILIDPSAPLEKHGASKLRPLSSEQKICIANETPRAKAC